MRNVWPFPLRLIRQVVVLSAVAAVPAAGLGAAAATLAILVPDDFLNGTNKAFVGMTRYEPAEIDGRDAVRAACENSASGLIVARRIDLRETPVIEWSWGTASAFDAAVDEESRAGDDFPLRLSLIHRGGMTPMGSRAVTYVWSSGKPAGADWISPYATQARMVAVQSGMPNRSMPWVTQRRDVRADFRRYFGLDVDFVDAVAIMTDCDDRATTAEAWYGPVRFLPENG